jgi:cytochrome b involved in lipid metabolism
MTNKTSKIAFLVAILVLILGVGYITMSKTENLPVPVVDQNESTGTFPVGTPGDASDTPSQGKTSIDSFTLAEVSLHKTESDCWTAINGNIYNVTAFINRHPGGDKNILKVCGIDATAIFSAQHGSQTNPNNQLSQFIIGTLK